MYTIRQVPQKSLFCYYYYFFLLFFDKLLDLKLFFSRVHRSWPLKCVNWTSERVTYQKFARKDGRIWEGRGQTYLSVSSFFLHSVIRMLVSANKVSDQKHWWLLYIWSTEYQL
jgi:hypothetical protein